MSSELEIQKYFRNGGNLQSLLDTYGIQAKRHGYHSNLISLKYNQILSPMNEKIVQECRGIIIDENNNWNIIARAFDKFFNYGEVHAATIDWKTAQVQEKLDGSLIILYYYSNGWHVASSGMPDASGCGWTIENDVTPPNFREYFWQTFFKCCPIDYLHNLSRDFCYYFELCGPLNRIVVMQEKSNLHILGARNIFDWKEISAKAASKLLINYIPAVNHYNLNNMDSIIKTFDETSPLAQEGYVVVDGNFNRVKIKNPKYVALHHAKSGLTPRAFVEIVRTGELSEIVSAFPEINKDLDYVKSLMDKNQAEIENDYERLKHISVQKDFAVEANKTKCPAALFQLRSKKVYNVQEFFAKMQIDSLIKLIDYKVDNSVNNNYNKYLT